MMTLKSSMISLVCLALAAVSCSSDDSDSNVCDKAAAKAQSCNMTLSDAEVAQCKNDPVLRCQAQCLVDTEGCDLTTNTTLLGCLADCESATSGTGGTGNNGAGGTTNSGACTEEAVTSGFVSSGDPATTDCPAYTACITPCIEPVQSCFTAGGACEGYVTCVLDCDCDQICVTNSCTALATEATCLNCYSSATLCALDCVGEAASCS